MTDILPLRREDEIHWNAFVRHHPQAHLYHLAGWRRVLASGPGHRAYYFGAWLEGRLTGILPLIAIAPPFSTPALFSLPFVNDGGLLAEDPATASALLEHALNLSRLLGAKQLELRHRVQDACSLPARAHRVAMVMSLPSRVEALHQRIGQKLRNQVRKAVRSGLRFRQGGLELLPEFYEVFARNMRDLGSPVWAPALFKRLLTEFPERTRIAVVSLGNLPLAAGCTLRFKQSVHIPWASSRRDFNHLCANVLLYTRLLERAVEDGYQTFDFGRSDPDGPHYRFKRQWGALEVPLFWHSWPGVPEAGATLEGHRKELEHLWQHLPVVVTQRLGPPIRRWLPQ